MGKNINIEGNLEEKESLFNLKSIFESIVQIAATFLICTFVFNYILLYGYVPSGSMENTIDTSSYIFVNRLDKNFDRFDIAVFKNDNNVNLMVKRIIGLPNDTILIKDNKVYVNGEELKEDYIKEQMYTFGELEYKVPEGCYFLLGDNRNNSNDSRFWDYPFVTQEELKGTVFVNFKIKDNPYIKFL